MQPERNGGCPLPVFVAVDAPDAEVERVGARRHGPGPGVVRVDFWRAATAPTPNCDDQLPGVALCRRWHAVRRQFIQRLLPPDLRSALIFRN